MALRQEELTSLCDDVDLDRDRALVERCQAGDSAAFGNLYARYYERLLRFCLRRLNDRHEAEDAAQEAFARAWKALPRFAGERRFYPWLTVIAGNICTDMLRRRSRSTPTDDMELTAQHPVGVVGEDTSEEMVLAAVDGELVNRALDRLSTRHRHVLAMREGSGWTYQQIADHEGVEIGTIETLLWRARQALKREFAAVSESKEALAGFLVATGALIRRTIFRAAHKSAAMNPPSGGSGDVPQRHGGCRRHRRGRGGSVHRTARAVERSERRGLGTGLGTGGAAPRPGILGLRAVRPPGATRLWRRVDRMRAPRRRAELAARGALHLRPAVAVPRARPVVSAGSSVAPTSGGSSSGTGGLSGGLNQAAGGLHNTVGGVTNGIGQTVTGVAGGVSSGLGQTVGGVTGGLGQTVGGVTGGVGSVGGLNTTLGGVTGTVNGLTQTLGLGSALPGSTGSGSSSGSGSTSGTTTTTAPGLLGGLLGGG